MPSPAERCGETALWNDATEQHRGTGAELIRKHDVTLAYVASDAGAGAMDASFRGEKEEKRPPKAFLCKMRGRRKKTTKFVQGAQRTAVATCYLAVLGPFKIRQGIHGCVNKFEGFCKQL